MKNRSSSYIDQRLKQRVEQYLKSTNTQYVDVAEMAAEFQQQYRMDYGRRNKTAFRIQVEKVHKVICEESGISALEDKHLAKRARRSKEDEGEDSSVLSDSSDSEADFSENENTNHMNNSLMSLYCKGNPENRAGQKEQGNSSPNPALQKGSSAEGASSCCTSNPTTTVSAGGWFIDKTGRKDQENILIDLSAESASSAVTKDTDLSALEPEKKPKSKKKEKRKKQREDESKGVDADIEESVMAKKARTKPPELQHSTVKFEDVGGNEETLTELCKLLIHMRHPEVYQQLGVMPPRGFLLHGPPGCGKTLLAQAVAGEMEMPILKVSAPELVSGISGESEQKLRELFEQAVSSAPCILFIDEIDAITPKREVASKDMERRIVAQLLTCMDDLNSSHNSAQVLVIGATNRPDALDPALRRAGRFDREICLGIPDEGARIKILRTLCRKLKLAADFDFARLARLTPGYVGADLMALCREAAMTAVNRLLLLQLETGIKCQNIDDVRTKSQDVSMSSDVAEDSGQASDHLSPKQGELEQLLSLLRNSESLSEEQLADLCINMDDFMEALARVQPSAKREGFATVPDVTWDDVGALQDIREELTMAILAPVRFPEQFKALGLSAPAGVLLAGPPGCGKTLLAKAVANESGLNFISVKGPELLNMYVGESERAVRQVFQRGQNSAPCVIFFDEIDALCPRRSGHESGPSVRVVNQLLTEMDGLETRRQVFIMAATNRPDIIDPAVIRPGRLDKVLYVGLPPADDRHAILLTITKGGTKPRLDLDVSLREIAHDQRCDCFTGADLSALVREASVNALKTHLGSQTAAPHAGHTFSSGSVKDIRVSRQNFEEAFKKVRPSVSKKELCKLLVHMHHPEVYQQLGVVPPRGFLLHGPPGCGKTLLAVAGSGASVRVVNQLLTAMDGLVKRHHTYIMAATNHPEYRPHIARYYQGN
ncbi:nuclear valosin-containing protein-like isoform X1 [Tachysurus vachellii]|uniref:nuclear valosin-containing protein-like isoform X1 n=1 Tax=Tachysurus vachellii TaxID=175792 RepID=UPI00296B3368|nr:nuclear valosin-containing protein-like isoform X1 [Tachysurus vachellii]XP_060720379.1 nuclear valosin-containing protein-like isoform X1 [Tachysurus vachellii]XP_060720380.1 nuclear valosin-containing protein-like isoform X1 [Tachysurus vachellii]